ncbi:MAG: site-specific DNA-methyltransferase [Fretibacterium sp.]|nr:site-specific DNA-methyltransferase [Fretibacterium sp.]
MDFCRELPDGTVKLIITSPPYNLGKEYERRVRIEDYLDNLVPRLGEFVRVLSRDGSLCWQTGSFVKQGEVYPLDIYFYPFFKRLGLHLRNRIIWHFGHGLHCLKRFSGRYETILWFTKSNTYTFNLDSVRIPSKQCQVGGVSSRGKNPEDVWEVTMDRLADDWDALIWDIPNVKNTHPEKLDHPCQYPVELAERCVLALTNEGDIVYDPFAGVGSSLVAALKNGRRAYGSEWERKFVDIGLERLQKLKEGRLRTRSICQKEWELKPGGCPRSPWQGKRSERL